MTTRHALPVARPAKVNQLKRLYATVPDAGCKGLCHAACGVILMTPLEYRRLWLSLGREPIGDLKTLFCPALTPEGRCGAYDVRPLICRLWGVVSDLPCPFGCRPERMLTSEEASALVARVRSIGGEGVACTHDLGGKG